MTTLPAGRFLDGGVAATATLAQGHPSRRGGVVRLDTSILVRIFGSRAAFVHGDTCILDRWNWLKRRLPLTANAETLLDVGCGTGAFTIGAARRGYRATGVSWDERNQGVAEARARLCGVSGASFVTGDVRRLDVIPGLESGYDVVICLECIEHILDDRKLFRDIAEKIKPGGRLLLTTPNYYYVPITREDRGPFLTEETSAHVRRGYTPEMLAELCGLAKLVCGEISYCSGVLSQKATGSWRVVRRLFRGTAVPWLLTFPLRLLPVVLPDTLLTKALNWPFFSICLEAYKPRFSPDPPERYLDFRGGCTIPAEVSS
jgi:2-polyprenyl-3-methyl-5-hydroxy-6-metoxy-1,4-benzoquinol methylase